MKLKEYIEKLQTYPEDLDMPDLTLKYPDGLFKFFDAGMVAQAALEALPKRVKKFYTSNFSRNEEDFGKFQGLSCRVCSYWQNMGHEKDCPVADLEKELDSIDSVDQMEAAIAKVQEESE